MKLAVYIRSIASGRGAEGVSATIALGLAAVGHQVDFLVEDETGQLTEKLKSHGKVDGQAGSVRVVNLRTAETSSITDGTTRWWAVSRGIVTGLTRTHYRPLDWVRPLIRLAVKDKPPVRALRRYVDQERPEAVLAFLNYPNIALLLAASVGERRTRYLVNVRNTISVAATHNESKWVRSVPSLMRRYFPLADGIIAPSQGVADDIATITNLPGRRITVVHNPVFRPEILALADGEVNHPWLRTADVPVVLAAGKLKPQKDFATLIEAFAKLRAQQPARLIILGAGPERDTLVALADQLNISADVDLPGQVDNPFAFYRRASLFVLSSRWEGLPNVLIEAMACGCPVVSTDCPSGPKEILGSGSGNQTLGPLVPMGDAAAMSDAMAATLADPPESSALVDRAKTFSLEAAINGYETALAPPAKDGA